MLDKRVIFALIGGWLLAVILPPQRLLTAFRPKG